jgi:hypothetical protein
LCRFSAAGDDDTNHVLRRPAAEKRQGTKSREVGQRRCRGLYGDLAAACGSRWLDRSGGGDRFGSRHRCARRGERAERALREMIDGAMAGRSGGVTRAWVLPAERQPDWRV